VSIVSQVWDYIATRPLARFIHGTSYNGTMTADGAMIVNDEVIALLAGPTLQYNRTVLVHTDRCYNLPASDSLIIVRVGK